MPSNLKQLAKLEINTDCCIGRTDASQFDGVHFGMQSTSSTLKLNMYSLFNEEQNIPTEYKWLNLSLFNEEQKQTR